MRSEGLLRAWSHVPLRAASILVLCIAAAACAGGARAKEPARLPADKVGRPTLASAEAMSLQSSVMALADTSIQRIGSELMLASKSRTPEERRDDANTRLILASALIAIPMEPDPIDALADILTNATLTADGQRNAAKGKAPDSPDVALLRALEQNEADAWRLAERWLNEPTRTALRAKIMEWPGPRPSGASVAFVRLSDIKRGGSTSVEAGEGMFDSLRAATEQADQVRLLTERSLFLMQRMPFLLRWHADVYTAGALATQEAQQTQAQIERLSALTAEMSQVMAGMGDQLSRERAAALQDLFTHIEAERKGALNQLVGIVQQERKATLAEAGKAVDLQRRAALKDILAVADFAGKTGSAWIGRTLLVGGLLIVFLLVGLLAVLLLYRRLVPALERRVSRN